MKYSQELKDYLKEISKGRYNDEITELINKKFDLNLTKKQIGNLKTRYKIVSGVDKKRKIGSRVFNKEQHEFIKNNQYDLSRQELSELLNKKFNLLRLERARR